MIVKRTHPVNKIKLLGDKVSSLTMTQLCRNSAHSASQTSRTESEETFFMQSIRNLIYFMSSLCNCNDLENSVEKSIHPACLCIAVSLRGKGILETAVTLTNCTYCLGCLDKHQLFVLCWIFPYNRRSSRQNWGGQTLIWDLNMTSGLSV